MVVFNPQKKEIDIKVVYYGPALCGKTTNLKSVHLNLNPRQRGELVSLATKDDRTLFFDFLPIQLENIRGFKTRFHIYTVPGQVFYTLTRKAVLTGVDGVIFVADSQNGKMKENIESLNDLKENLKYYNKTLESIPVVFQYNKRDLPDLISLHEINEQLNSMQAPFFEACALSGKGVMETLTMCCKMILKQMQNKSRADKPAVRIAADAVPGGGPPAAELPHLTLAENMPAETDATADLPAPQPEEQTADTNREADPPVLIDASPSHNAYSPLNGPSSLCTDEADVTLKIEVPEENRQAKIVPIQEEVSAQNLSKHDDGKRMCPRCSLKFKPNVKQCPICRIPLVPEDQRDMLKNGNSTLVQAPLPASGNGENAGDSIVVRKAPDDGKDAQQLEIISCEQPLKASAHSVTIPMVMRLKQNNAEVKIELTISVNNIMHQQH